MKVLVVGGGVVGRSTAYYLSGRGLDVEVVESGDGPSPTSSASLGILTHFNGGRDAYSTLYRDGHALHAQLAGQLGEETGIDVGWRPLGGMDLAFEASDEARLEDLLAFNRQRGCAAEWLEGAALRQLEPSLSSQVRSALFFPGDHRVDPVQLSKALLQGARRHGARLHSGVKVLGFEREGRTSVGVRTDSGVMWADRVVVTAGAWTGELVGEGLGARVRVRPIRGQHRRFAGGDRLGHILRPGEYYLVPSWGQIIVGATVEEVGFERQNTPEASRLFSALFSRVLNLDPRPAGAWAGLRPKPKGGRPQIGPLREHPQIFVASGHYKNGVLLGPITGKVISQWIVDGEPDRDMEYFAPER